MNTTMKLKKEDYLTIIQIGMLMNMLLSTQAYA